MSDPQLRWGDALRLRAAACGYRTQKELAAAVGVSLTTVQSWWRSATLPPMRYGNDHRLMEVLELSSQSQLRHLPALVGGATDDRAEKVRQMLALLKEVDPAALPISAVMAALLEWGVTKPTIARIMEEIDKAEIKPADHEIRNVS